MSYLLSPVDYKTIKVLFPTSIWHFSLSLEEILLWYDRQKFFCYNLFLDDMIISLDIINHLCCICSNFIFQSALSLISLGNKFKGDKIYLRKAEN